ncbi:AzlC family ABC transporter permease [Bordetella genomosp. 12]|uniref:Azaleucine resistance protein AzlC n=1 Tax=Bordetella genomosp. 12 TaxID=463035 RepID=A0A261VBC1_9BORD|nr:AzlC family ABC transporter permease [Bordetella genomosp. 12]OZI71061.1 azaleucine resistance protein AzlC [Bordetella genomosp. 12]
MTSNAVEAPTGTVAGLKACLPVMIGYFPVAVAFGIAASGVGLAPYQVVLISVLVYAGASQFLLLASIKSGTPWIWVVALCSLLNARHLLYGPILARLLPESLRTRLRLAFLLTDEVFATALHQLGDVTPAQRARWMTALGLGAWLTWIAGTAVGVFAGDSLEQHYPVLSRVMRFALPALFLALVCQTARRGMMVPLCAGFGVSALLTIAGQGTLGILLGALAGCLCFRQEKP